MSTSALVPVLVVGAAKATIILGVAGLLDVLLLRRRASASTRHFVWVLGVAGALIGPVLGLALPSIDVPVFGARAVVVDSPPVLVSAPTARGTIETTPPTETSRPTVADGPRREPSVGAVPASSVEGNADRWRPGAISLLVILYCAGVALILGVIVIDHVIVWRIARRATVVRDADWSSLLRTLAHRSGVRRPVQLLRSADSVMPLTTGTVRPRIIVPAAADAWPEELRESVVLHELAHVSRHDCLTQLLGVVACAVHWPNPLVWFAAARLRVERELACDDLVVARGIDTHDYASHLLRVARGLRIARLAVSMAASRGLEARLRALIDESRRRNVPRSRWVFATTILALVFISLLSAARPSRATAATSVAVEGRRISGGPSLDPAVIRAELTAPSRTGPAVSSVPTAALAPAHQQPVERGDFHVRLAAPSDGPRNAGRIHVMLQTPGLNTFYELPERMEGLSASQLMLNGTPLEFRLRRDAGTFRFTGVARDGRGTGRFEFTHDPAFIDSLARRGIRAPSARQQFSFARHDVSVAYIDAFLREGYAVPTPEQLDRAGMSSVDLDYVRDMAALGYRVGTVDALVRMANRGVSPGQVRSLAALGYRNLSVSELVALDDQDINSVFIREANTRAGRQLTVREIIARRLGPGTTEISSATPSPSSAPTARDPERRDALVFDDTVATGKWTLVSRGDGWLQLDIEWANVNQWRRLVRPSDLIGITGFGVVGPTPVVFRIERDAGVFSFDGSVERGRGAGSFSFTPNREFAGTLRSLGVKDAEVVGVHNLKNLAFGFIEAESVREFMAAGFSQLTLDDVLSLAIRQVTPGYLRELKGLGVRGIDSVEDLVEVRFVNVPVAYARELSTLGYSQLEYRDLVDLYRARVSAEFIRQQQAAGRRGLTPAELIDLRRR